MEGNIPWIILSLILFMHICEGKSDPINFIVLSNIRSLRAVIGGLDLSGHPPSGSKLILGLSLIIWATY